MKVVKAAQMQALDRETIEDVGIHGLILMENAGRGTAEIIMSTFGQELSQKGALVVAGPGNNGGDGFVIARHLVQAGHDVHVISLAPDEKFRGDALVNLGIVRNLGIPVTLCVSEEVLLENYAAFEQAGVIVDALFGTGLGRPLAGRFAQAVGYMNRVEAPVISVDIPSGLSSDTGLPLGAAVEADVTCTMAMPKIGHVSWPGCEYTGTLHIIDIGIPRSVVDKADIDVEAIGRDELAGLLKARPGSGHKGTFGHVVIVGGSRGKSGAAVLAAEGALHSGAGLVTVACAASSQPVMAQKLTEAMTLGISEADSGEPSEKAVDELVMFAENKKALVIGPGLGIGREAASFVQALVQRVTIPLVADADALTGLADSLDLLKDRKNGADTVLTPHPGEMARLCKCSVQEVQADRIGKALGLSGDTGAFVVLKGSRTVIAAPDGRVCINTTGNSGMGTGGMGDVLSGMIGALLAQGYEAWEAARIGVCAHGAAADLLASARGPYGWTAGELASWLPRVWGMALR